MLLELHVRDLALVEDVWLEFSDGLTVLSGETGAGKTVLVEALKLLLGDRADTTLIRTGAAETVVEGRIVVGGVERVVRRRIGADGRSRCTIDGEMVTVGALGELLDGLIDLHGQHEHQALLSPSRHAGYLDRFAGAPATEALDRYQAAYAACEHARRTLDALDRSLADRERRSEYLRFQVAEIESVAPRIGEDTELESRLPKLRYAERLMAAVAGALQALREEAGATDRLGEAAGALAGTSGLDRALDELASDLTDALQTVEGVGYRLREYGESVQHDPRELDETESRLAALRALKRKFGASLEEVLAASDAARQELETLEAGELGRVAARGALEAAEAEVAGAAAELMRVRRAAAPGFTESLGNAAADLALSGARFEVLFGEAPREMWTQEGPGRVEFLFAASSGEAPKPLAKVASGGEISRVMLALKGVLGHADRTPVLVFDEVDVGIGGATARAVGERLAELATRHQVLVITHLAQVAAKARHHIVVEKASEGSRAVTRAHVVTGEARVREVARMLSGSSSDLSTEHARELLGRNAEA